MLGHSLLTQFDEVSFNEVTLPFVDTLEKAREVVQQINAGCGHATACARSCSARSSTPSSREISARPTRLFLDCFEIFISPLEAELGVHVLARGRALARCATSTTITTASRR